MGVCGVVVAAFAAHSQWPRPSVSSSRKWAWRWLPLLILCPGCCRAVTVDGPAGKCSELVLCSLDCLQPEDFAQPDVSIPQPKGAQATSHGCADVHLVVAAGQTLATLMYPLSAPLCLHYVAAAVKLFTGAKLQSCKHRNSSTVAPRALPTALSPNDRAAPAEANRAPMATAVLLGSILECCRCTVD